VQFIERMAARVPSARFLLFEGPADAREPAFFSENIGGLGRTLGRVESESLRVHDTGSAVSQTLVYKLKR